MRRCHIYPTKHRKAKPWRPVASNFFHFRFSKKINVFNQFLILKLSISFCCVLHVSYFVLLKCFVYFELPLQFLPVEPLH